MDEKISSGCEMMDKLLDGGYESDVITSIYGPAGTGKTTLCLLASIQVSKTKKIIFIDTEGGFSITRLSQLTPDYKSVIEKIFILRPTNFEEQRKAFEKLKAEVNEKIGLIVVDTVSNLYRAEYKKEDIAETNRSLGTQLSVLVEIARKNKIPVLLTNQVYASFDDKSKINIVGGDLLNYRSKCLIELQSSHGSKRKAILRKHRSLPQREIVYEIKEQGLFEVKGGFRMF